MEDGGGLASYGNLTLANATFSGNSASDSGGGIYVSSGSTILSGPSNGSDGNIIGSDPNLGTLANNGGFNHTHALLPSSPASDMSNRP